MKTFAVVIFIAALGQMSNSSSVSTTETAPVARKNYELTVEMFETLPEEAIAGIIAEKMAYGYDDKVEEIETRIENIVEKIREVSASTDLPGYVWNQLQKAKSELLRFQYLINKYRYSCGVTATYVKMREELSDVMKDTKNKTLIALWKDFIKYMDVDVDIFDAEPVSDEWNEKLTKIVESIPKNELAAVVLQRCDKVNYAIDIRDYGN